MSEPERKGTRRLLLAMGLASGITSVPSAAIVLALPTIHRQFNASLTELEWTVTGYLLAYSALLIAAGRLADVFGRVRLLTWGTILYMAASVPAALAGNATVLIVGLVGVGVGAAVLTPASLAIVTDGFRGEQRGMAVGVWGAATALFSGIGPAIGGVLTQEASWRWILWLNVIVGAVILIGVRRTAESFDEQATHRIDFTGLALSAAGLGAITLALNEAPAPWAIGSARFLVVIVGGVLLLAGFAIVERHARQRLSLDALCRAVASAGAARTGDRSGADADESRRAELDARSQSRSRGRDHHDARWPGRDVRGGALRPAVRDAADGSHRQFGRRPGRAHNR